MLIAFVTKSKSTDLVFVDKEKPSSTVPDVKKEGSSKEKRLNRPTSDTQPPSNKTLIEVAKKDSLLA